MGSLSKPYGGLFRTHSHTCAYVVDFYISELDASDKTRRTYSAALRQYCSWLEARGLGINDAKRADVLAYRDALIAEKSPATVNAYLTAVRSLHAWLESHMAMPDVSAGIKGVKKRAVVGRDALTLEQARRLLNEDADGEQGLRDAALINLMLRRGLRTIEVSRADIGDLRQMGGIAVLYVQGKGHGAKDDFVVLGDECLSPIHAYLEARGKAEDSAPLFSSIGNRNKGGRMTTRAISRIVKDAYRRHGIADPHLTAHSLRHTAVTLSLKAGATIQEAQAMARHANVATTMGYAHNLDKLEAKAERRIDELLAV